jgi:hypothetical protein
VDVGVLLAAGVAVGVGEGVPAGTKAHPPVVEPPDPLQKY